MCDFSEEYATRKNKRREVKLVANWMASATVKEEQLQKTEVFYASSLANMNEHTVKWTEEGKRKRRVTRHEIGRGVDVRLI